MEWIREKCTQHMFFRQSYKYVAADADIQFEGKRYQLKKGEEVTFDYNGMYARAGDSFPWGMGKRGCPGASIGKHIVATIVFA
eukprot:gene4600-16388_t